MRKFLALLFAFCSITVSAQIAAGFGEADPDAWFDKEPYFWCKNQTYYPIYNVTLIYNQEYEYSLNNNAWLSGGILTLGKSNGIEFSPGDTVHLLIGGQCVGMWTCPKSPTANLPQMKGGGGGAKKIGKTIWKYVKRIRR